MMVVATFSDGVGSGGNVALLYIATPQSVIRIPKSTWSGALVLKRKNPPKNTRHVLMMHTSSSQSP